MKTFKIENTFVTIWNNNIPNTPAVYIHVGEGNGENIWNLCKELNCKPFNLIAITISNWNDNLSPWQAFVFSKDEPFKGQANSYLKILLEKIIPTVEKELSFKPSHSILAGYSLAGLFALWSCYNTDVFTRIVCCSGSLWYPNFIDYAKCNSFKRIPDCIYLSLGDKESKSKNKILQNVEANTYDLYNYLKNQGFLTILKMNPGGHFKDSDLRLADGIFWTLNQ